MQRRGLNVKPRLVVAIVQHPIRETEEGSKMKPKNRMIDLVRTSSNVMQAKGSRQSVHERSADLMNRMRGIDCMLTDMKVEIQRLRNERIYLRLLRYELTDTLPIGAGQSKTVGTGTPDVADGMHVAQPGGVLDERGNHRRASEDRDVLRARNLHED